MSTTSLHAHRLKFWLPRFKEREGGQCASCPFLTGNDVQFGKVVDALRIKQARVDGKRVPKPPGAMVVRRARSIIRFDIMNGAYDFACHATVYGPDMRPRSQQQYRQCPGATAFAKSLAKEK